MPMGMALWGFFTSSPGGGGGEDEEQTGLNWAKKYTFDFSLLHQLMTFGLLEFQDTNPHYQQTNACRQPEERKRVVVLAGTLQNVEKLGKQMDFINCFAKTLNGLFFRVRPQDGNTRPFGRRRLRNRAPRANNSRLVLQWNHINTMESGSSPPPPLMTATDCFGISDSRHKYA